MRKCGNPKRKNAIQGTRNESSLKDQTHDKMGYTYDSEADQIQVRIYTQMSMEKSSVRFATFGRQQKPCRAGVGMRHPNISQETLNQKVVNLMLYGRE